MTKEEKAAYDKQYRIDNREKKAANSKQYRADNAEKIKERKKKAYDDRDAVERANWHHQYYIDNAERMKPRQQQYNIDNAEKIKQYKHQYRIDNPEKEQAPHRRKSSTISNWKGYGVIGDLSFIYDVAYITATHCWVCKKTFKDTNDRCLDHCHSSGEFRQILCRSCNVMDSWKKY